MFKNIILILFTTLTFSSFASVEINQKIEVLARSFPIGAFSKFTVEAVKPLWGKKITQKDVTYGFYGAQAELEPVQSSTISRQKHLSFPYSNFGIISRQESGYKEIKNIDTFDCTKVLSGKIEKRVWEPALRLDIRVFFHVRK